MVQRQYIDTRAQFDLARAPRRGGEKDVLRRRQAMHGGGVMFGEMVGVEPGGIKPFNLYEAISIDLGQLLTRNRFYMIKYTELKCHIETLLCVHTAHAQP
jgi:hypothetical protein